MSSMFFPISSLVYILVVVLLITMQPFKAHVSYYTTINAVFMLLIALLYVSWTGMQMADINMPNLSKFFAFLALVAAILPLLYITVIILQWMYSHGKFGLELIGRLCAWRRGYTLTE